MVALFVCPAWIREGLGTFLIEHAKSNDKLRGFRKIVIQGDPHARDFYLSIGALPRGYRASASIQGRLLPLFEIDLTANRGHEELVDVGN